MTDARVRRGRATEEAVAQYMRENGWPDAKRVPASIPGKDIVNIPALSVEVKARRELNLPAWLRDAEKRDGLPVVVHRPDGMGLETVHLWPATFRFMDAVILLQEGGY